MKKYLFASLILGATPAFAAELNCKGENWSFLIEKNEGHKVGSLIFMGNVVERVEMVKQSVNVPEYSKLKALYLGETSLDSYGMYVFKAKDNKSHIAFLESKSHLGHKKVIEFRCTFGR